MSAIKNYGDPFVEQKVNPRLSLRLFEEYIQCMHAAFDSKAFSSETFIFDNVEPDSTIVTVSWRSYDFIEDAKCVPEKVK